MEQGTHLPQAGAWRFALLSSTGLLSPQHSYCHMPVRGEEQDKKDMAISMMASLSFGQVPSVYYSSIAVQVTSRITTCR